VSARDILEAMKRSGMPLNIVILDACRDNPLRQSARSTSRGLVVPALPQGIKGTAVMFSAAPGETAEDGPAGANGVFTGALLETLNQPGLKLEDVLKRTARRISQLTANRQRPWFNSSIYGDFYFSETARSGAEPAPAPAPAARPNAAEGSQVEIVFWQSIQDSDISRRCLNPISHSIRMAPLRCWHGRNWPCCASPWGYRRRELDAVT
jgi:uncharacterized caspase-like protein